MIGVLVHPGRLIDREALRIAEMLDQGRERATKRRSVGDLRQGGRVADLPIQADYRVSREVRCELHKVAL